MKRFVTILTLITLVLSLCACSGSSRQGMSVKPSEFSKETREVLAPFMDELQFFDISFYESAKYWNISLWVKRGGEWFEDGRVSGEVKASSMRIAVWITDNGFELYSIENDGYQKYSYPQLETDFDKSAAFFVSKLDGETPLELDCELTLWAKYGTEKTKIETSATSADFRATDYNSGSVVTLTVSDEPFEV